jgi:DNA invertase Pin-like site-specific DNA recombinase
MAIDTKQRAKIRSRIKARFERARRVPTEDEVDQMLQMLDTGSSVSEVATALGFSRPTVYKYVRKAIA